MTKMTPQEAFYNSLAAISVLGMELERAKMLRLLGGGPSAQLFHRMLDQHRKLVDHFVKKWGPK